MTNEFVPIKGYEGYYSISPDGIVKSLERQVAYKSGGHMMTLREKVLKPGPDAHGYLTVVLCKNGSGLTHGIHRLLATHFLEPVDGKYHVNHKDGNNQNNSLDNLEWVTPKENIRHAFFVLERGNGTKRKGAKFNIEDIKKILSSFYEKGNTLKETAAITGFTKSSVQNIVYVNRYKPDIKKLVANGVVKLPEAIAKKALAA